MTLPLVALGQPHVDAHNTEREAINSLQTDGIEIAYAENVTNTVTVVSGSLVYSQIDGCGIVVPPQSYPWRIDFEACLQVTTAGAGAMYLALMEIPTAGGTPTLVQSAVKEILSTNSGTYSKLAGTAKSSRRFDPTTTYRTFCLSLVNLLDSGSGLVSNSANSATNPSWIGAIRL